MWVVFSEVRVAGSWEFGAELLPGAPTTISVLQSEQTLGIGSDIYNLLDLALGTLGSYIREWDIETHIDSCTNLWVRLMEDLRP